MDVPADVWNNAILYTRIVLCGAVGNIGYNMNAGILRGLGDSKASLYFLMVSAFVNIVLDIILVAVFGLGVSGVAFCNDNSHVPCLDCQHNLHHAKIPGT